MTAADRWLDAARGVLERVATTQTGAIEAASHIFAESIAVYRLVHVFGSCRSCGPSAPTVPASSARWPW